MKRLLFSLITFMALCAVSCKPQDPNIVVLNITLDRSELNLYTGDERIIVADITLADENESSVIPVSWTSSDNTVASVKKGTVKALKEGEAVITASAGGKTAICTVTVQSYKEGHIGTPHKVVGNKSGSIDGTPYYFHQFYQGGSGELTCYDNATFTAEWSKCSEYLAYVGFNYGTGSAAAVRSNKSISFDFAYTKATSSNWSGIGIYGWTESPLTEFTIIEDWTGNNATTVEKIGEYKVDGVTYSLHVLLTNRMSIHGSNETFLQIHSVRESKRNNGHIDLNAHFEEWDKIMHGQTQSIMYYGGGQKDCVLKLGSRICQVCFDVDQVGGTSGTFDCTMLKMSD